MKKYAIPTNGDINELIRVLSILLSKGYVYGTTCDGYDCREKDIDNFIKTREDYLANSQYNYWQEFRYVVIGMHKVCQMTVYGYNATPFECSVVTLEEFLKLNEQ